VAAFRDKQAALFTKSVNGHGISEHEGQAAAAPRRFAPTWRVALRRATTNLVENRALIMRVFLPFVAGYYLSYLFRTINALIAVPLALELGLGAGDLGLLTSVYFLTFAVAQIPIGVLLDRYGPRRIQSALLVAAAAGAALFAASDDFLLLLAGRALIGLGVAAALTAGLKALVLWFPRDRLPLLNGLMVMLGALGAVTATSPAELLLASFGWRGLFGLFAAVTAGCAVMIYLVVPEAAPAASGAASVDLRKVFTDPRFWRIAPLSATCIGTAWALHGLWAAQWLTDVESLDRTAMVWHLFTMAVALSLGAILLGVAADRLRRRGVGPQVLLGLVATVFITAQLALILRWPLPSYFLWAIVAAVGAATVLSYAILAEYFPKELAGQANGVLNFSTSVQRLCCNTQPAPCFSTGHPRRGIIPKSPTRLPLHSTSLSRSWRGSGLRFLGFFSDLRGRAAHISPNCLMVPPALTLWSVERTGGTAAVHQGRDHPWKAVDLHQVMRTEGSVRSCRASSDSLAPGHRK
jgi:MFS family permease